MNPIQPQFSGLFRIPISPEKLENLEYSSSTYDTFIKISDDKNAIEVITSHPLGTNDKANLKEVKSAVERLTGYGHFDSQLRSEGNSDVNNPKRAELRKKVKDIMDDVHKAFLTRQKEDGAVIDLSTPENPFI